MVDEDLVAFFEDFNVGGSYGGESFLAIRDMPDEIRAMAGLNSQSTNYEILVITSQMTTLGITGNKEVLVAGTAYRVRDLRMIDDGALSVASLTKI